MRLTWLRAAVVAACLMPAPAVYGVPEDFDAAIQEASAAKQALQREREIAALERAVAASDSGHTVPESQSVAVLERLYELYAGGNPLAVESDRRKSVAVARRLLSYHQARLRPVAAEVEKYCFALYWMESVLRDYEHSLEHIKCYLNSVEVSKGQASIEAARSWNSIGQLQLALERYPESEQAFHKAASILGQGGEHAFDAAFVWSSYSALLEKEGRYDEQEAALQKSVAIIEGAQQVDIESLAFQQAAFANFYYRWAREAEGDAIVWRAYTSLNSRDPNSFATGLYAWRAGGAALRAGRLTEARSLFQRALDIHRRHLGERYMQVGAIMLNLADVDQAEGNTPAALARIDDAMDFWRKTGWESSTEYAGAMLMAGRLRSQLRQYAPARDLLQGARERFRANGDSTHQAVWATFMLANIEEQLGNDGRSAQLWDEVISDVRAAIIAGDNLRLDAVKARAAYAPIVNEFLRRQAQSKAGDASKTFEAAQMTNTTDTAATLAKTAVRYAASDSQQFAALREYAELTRQWRKVELDLAKATPDELPGIRASRAQIDSRLRQVRDQVQTSMPLLESLVSSSPISASEVQGLLRRDEALVTYHFDPQGAYVWVVTKSAVRFVALPDGHDAIAANVKRLREGLRLGGSGVPAFNFQTALQLYRDLIEPIEPQLAGILFVHVIPDGPLRSVPLSILLTQSPVAETAYKTQPWAARRFAFSYWPAVGSFKAMRRTQALATAPRTFLGVGDPQLNGPPALNTSIASRGILRGARVSLEDIRNLPRISESAQEIRSMARVLGADPSDVLVGRDATKTRLKTKKLELYQVIAFATHGLVNGELEGVTEPALIMTPPTGSRDGRDGLLTASEIAEFNLRANWVILSACNTAASDGSAGGEYLSGLAKAFFHAGARSVLVSHWYVSSNATAILTTEAVRRHRAGMPKAEALRQAMLNMLDNPPTPAFAHPAYWGPFVLVGD